jgi:hypothetical protein
MASKVIKNLRSVAEASRRENGTLIPLGEQLIEAADLIATMQAREAELVGALEWYGEQARLCRLIHREGDEGRNNLSADGGAKAARTLQGPSDE